MRLFLKSLMPVDTGLDGFGPFSQAYGPQPGGTGFASHEFSETDGIAGGSTVVSTDRYASSGRPSLQLMYQGPAPSRAERAGLLANAVVFEASEAFDGVIERFIALGRSPYAPPLPRASSHQSSSGVFGSASPIEQNWLQLVEALDGRLAQTEGRLTQALEDAESLRAEAAPKSEQYLKALRKVTALKRDLRQVQELKQQLSTENEALTAENETLRQVCVEADAALEQAEVAIQDANARAEENAELASQAIDLQAQVEELQGILTAAQEEVQQLRQVTQMSARSANLLVGTEQELRLQAERHAAEYHQVIESAEAGLVELRLALQSLQRKFQQASLQTKTLDSERDAEGTRELEELKALLAAKQVEIGALTTQLRSAEVLKSDGATLRAELASARAAEQAAKEDAKAARAELQDNKALLAKMAGLRKKLKAAGVARDNAIAQSLEYRQATRRALATAKREKARADSNEGQTDGVTRQMERTRRLIAQESARQVKVDNRARSQVRLPKSDRVPSAHTRVAKAFEFFDLPPNATYNVVKATYWAFAEVNSVDRLQGSSEKARAIAGHKLLQANLAFEILAAHSGKQKPEMVKRESA